MNGSIGVTTPMVHNVFISYSAADKHIADTVVEGLEGHGIRCWVAPRDILPGGEYGEQIIEGISECQVMVLIFSKHSNSSEQVVREVERAVHAQKIIIPFRIENYQPTGSMEYFLSLPQWMDAYAGSLKLHIEQLAATVRAILEGGSVAPVPVPASSSGGKSWFIGAGIIVALLLVGVGLWLGRQHETKPAFVAQTTPRVTEAPETTPSPTPPITAPTISAAPPVERPAAPPRSPGMTDEEAAEALIKQGIAAYDSGNFDAALDLHTRALARNPASAEAYFHRGNAHKARHDLDTAIGDYNMAVSLKPKQSDTFYNRGNAYLEKGETDQAIKDYSLALELAPGNWLALNNRGCAYKGRGDFDLAIADFTRALQLKSDFTQARENRELTYRDQAKAAAKKKNRKPEVLFDNGNLYLVLNRPTRTTMFTLNTPCTITSITTYHWNDGRGARPGTIGIRQQGGRTFGPWKASGLKGQGNVPNATWIVEPNVTLPPGTYTVLDSSPDTWSQNAGSMGSGMARLEGYSN